ncbi:hypothetical protein E2C01_041485 [Portunus trituberculatus]|uniref:Uncharacterized protein n=1 Tax=Portunus trituberculatus TaxID=210409 RepID=A0A5B7FR27_PORTR|nr:hypothetical protein [Portunus trituberculatus]
MGVSLGDAGGLSGARTTDSYVQGGRTYKESWNKAATDRCQGNGVCLRRRRRWLVVMVVVGEDSCFPSTTLSRPSSLAQSSTKTTEGRTVITPGSLNK